MSERAKALDAFSTVIATCNGAIHMCSESPTSSEKPPDVAVLHKDFLSLLLLLRGSTTKLSLAMKPSSPAYTAVHTPLIDTSNHIAALAHCVAFLQPSVHGKALVQEFQRAATDIFNAIKSLLTVLAGEGHLNNNLNEYLVRTGEVHDLIDLTRSTGPNGLSENNTGAIRKKWLQDKGSLEDGSSELGDILTREENGGEVYEDDGWDEMGMDVDAALNPEERERVKQAQTIIRLSTLLHSRILRDILSPTPSIYAIPTELDKLAPCSSSLLVASDDFISSLHPPHDTKSITEELASFRSSIDSLNIAVDAILSSHGLFIQMENLNLEGTASKPVAKWFQTCFQQIYKSMDGFSGSLATT